MEIAPAAASDWQRVGRVIGSAFAADPVSLWTFGDPALIVTTFQALARHVYLPRGRCFLAGEAGGTMWLGPGADKSLPKLATLALARHLVAGAGLRAVWRAMAIDAAMQKHRPAAPHLYLFAVGVDPAYRGKGLGKRLLETELAAADAARLPAYLENSNPANTGFYMSRGFVPGASFGPPGCPPLLAMWREPAGG